MPLRMQHETAQNIDSTTIGQNQSIAKLPIFEKPLNLQDQAAEHKLGRINLKKNNTYYDQTTDNQK